jgi:pimeloyl-ACP methyl ester carboxylesterase
MFGFGLYQLPRVGEWVSRQRLNRLEAERAVRLGLRIIAADVRTIDPELIRAHVDQLVRHQAEHDAGPAFLEAARSLMALGRRPRVARWILGGVSAPVLMVHGTQDRLVPLRFAKRAAASRGWELRLLPGVGHVPQMEAPDRWIALVDPWVRSIEPGAVDVERRSS